MIFLCSPALADLHTKGRNDENTGAAVCGIRDATRRVQLVELPIFVQSSNLPNFVDAAQCGDKAGNWSLSLDLQARSSSCAATTTTTPTNSPAFRPAAFRARADDRAAPHHTCKIVPKQGSARHQPARRPEIRAHSQFGLRSKAPLLRYRAFYRE